MTLVLSPEDEQEWGWQEHESGAGHCPGEGGVEWAWGGRLEAESRLGGGQEG